MRVSNVITSFTRWIAEYSLVKLIWLVLFLLIVLIYPSVTIAANDSRAQSKQIGGNEIITGTCGIKFGDNIEPYITGDSAGFGRTVEGFYFQYMNLKPPVNLREMFPDLRTVKLSGVADDNKRALVLQLDGGTPAGYASVYQSVKAVREYLREKYKITKPLRGNGDGDEEYGDNDANRIRMHCDGSSFSIEYTSHLMSEYIERLKVMRQKYKEDLKSSLKKIM